MHNYYIVNIIIRVSVYIFAFVISLTSLQALNLEKILKKNNTIYRILFYILLSIALGYLVGSFIMQFLPNFSEINSINSVIDNFFI